MVYYFVIGEDGNRYGPADVDTLVQWTREGRIIDSTQLIERGAERCILASSLTAIASELRRGRPVASVSVERDGSTPAPSAQEAQATGRPGWRRRQYRRCADSRPFPMPPTVPYAHRPPDIYSPRSRIAAGLLAIFLGGFGIHRFYLGYTAVGLVMLLITVAGSSCVPYGCGAVWLWAFIEGIICLTGGMRDAEGRELRP